MKKNIYILSGNIHSGKTTLLQNWLKTKENVSGFLSPDIDGKRHFLNIKTKKKKLLEVGNSNLNIGKYYFDENVFQWAKEEIENQLFDKNEWLIIDEIGPLEIKSNKGFHHLIEKIIAHENIDKKILFIVRDFLVQEFIEKYNIENAEVLPKKYFKNEKITPLHGIVLAGGKSSRMHSDKALLIYENEEQWKVAAQLLNPFIKKVYISINQNQSKIWTNFENNKFIVDKEDFKNKGPISGILSIAEENNENGFAVLGIDYPFLRLENLIELNNERSEHFEAVCFEINGFLEPLCTIYEKSAIEKMKIYFENGGESLSKFLKTIKTKIITTEDSNFLRNINSRKEFLAIKNKSL